MSRIFRYAALMIGLAFAAEGVSAQVTTGTPSFGSFGGGPDIINLANLNSHIDIPVLNKAGRGLNFTYDLTYDGSTWYPVTSVGTTTWQPIYNWGWRAVTEAAVGYLSYHLYSQRDSSNCLHYYWDTWVYHDPWGVPHPFSGVAEKDHGSTTCGVTAFFGFTSVADDGSGYTLDVNTTSNGYDMGTTPIYDTKGKVISAPRLAGSGAGSSTDRNGNYVSAISGGQFFDTLSSTTPVLTVSQAVPPSSTTFTYTAPSGSFAAYTMKYSTYNVQTNFGCSNVVDYGTNGTTTAYLVSEIDLPDGTKYLFNYEPTYGHSGYVTGRLKSITLPTGGSVTYSYGANGTNGIKCSDGSASTLTRTLSDGASWSAAWTYSRTLGSGAASATLVTAPKLSYDSAANQSILQFQGIYETQSDVYQGAAPTFTSLPIPEATLQTAGLLQEVQKCYNTSASPCTSTAVTLPISSQAVTNIFPGSSGQQSQVVSTYNTYGQLTEEDDYNYGVGAPGALLRKKVITIQTVGTYQAIQTAQIQDGSGNIVGQTTMTFDEGSVTATTGTPQHTNPTVGRGNPTTIVYMVTGGVTLARTLTYFDTGNVATSTDLNLATTTYNYADAISTCGQSFPTGVTEPITGLSQAMTWTCVGGVSTSVLDENGQTTATSYTDTQFWRPHSTTDQASNMTALAYNGQTSVESSMLFNGTVSTSDKLVTLDGLGRSHISQTKQSPTSTTYDSVETDYDVVGRPYRITIPYNASAGQTTSGSTPSTNTTYDALGRVLTVTDAGGGIITYSYSQNDIYQTLGPAPSGENAKRRQSEFDSLGRLVSVCEITVGTTAWPAGTCAQNASATGYWAKYVYDANGNLTGVTQNAQSTSNQQTRTYHYDGVSRMTSETNPETGTVLYVYDSDSSCGFFPGDLVKIVDAVGNTTCRSYDWLRRTVAVTYNGPYALVTPNRYFVYDNATVNGIAMTNTKTRLAEAYTCYSPCSTKITDVGLSYTNRGETSDVYESTPHSGGYYHVPATYWANGGQIR